MGGVPPKSVSPFLPGKKSVKGGGTPLTDKIRKVVFDPSPKLWAFRIFGKAENLNTYRHAANYNGSDLWRISHVFGTILKREIIAFITL